MFPQSIKSTIKSTKSVKKTPPPFSLRLSFDERARLEQESGDMPLGAYIRIKLFSGPQSARKSRAKRPIQDQQILAKLLGELGQSRVASNLNQLAKAANSGSLIINKDVEDALFVACESVNAIRHQLITALGLESEDRQ